MVMEPGSLYITDVSRAQYENPKENKNDWVIKRLTNDLYSDHCLAHFPAQILLLNLLGLR